MHRPRTWTYSGWPSPSASLASTISYFHSQGSLLSSAGVIVPVDAGAIPLSLPGSENHPVTVATGSPLSWGRVGVRSVAAFAPSKLWTSASDCNSLDVSVTTASETPVGAGASPIGAAATPTGWAAGSSGRVALAVAARVPVSKTRASDLRVLSPAPGAGSEPRIAPYSLFSAGPKALLRPGWRTTITAARASPRAMHAAIARAGLGVRG